MTPLTADQVRRHRASIDRRHVVAHAPRGRAEATARRTLFFAARVERPGAARPARSVAAGGPDRHR